MRCPKENPRVGDGRPALATTSDVEPRGHVRSRPPLAPGHLINQRSKHVQRLFDIVRATRVRPRLDLPRCPLRPSQVGFRLLTRPAKEQCIDVQPLRKRARPHEVLPPDRGPERFRHHRLVADPSQVRQQVVAGSLVPEQELQERFGFVAPRFGSTKGRGFAASRSTTAAPATSSRGASTGRSPRSTTASGWATGSGFGDGRTHPDNGFGQDGRQLRSRARDRPSSATIHRLHQFGFA